MDPVNLGPSLIRAFGKYSGDELFHEDDNGDAYYKLKEKVSTKYHKGKPVKLCAHDAPRA